MYSFFRSMNWRALALFSLMVGLTGCAYLPETGSSSKPKKVFWELPDEELTVPAPKRPGMEPRKTEWAEKERVEKVAPAPKKVAAEKPAGRPPRSTAAKNPKIVDVPAKETAGGAAEVAAKDKRGWWPFGGSRGDKADADSDANGVSDPPPAKVVRAPTPKPVEIPADTTATSAIGVVGYRLQHGDALIVKITGPENHVVEDQIDERGNISLPYLNEPVKVAGMTGSELEEYVQDVYINVEKIFKRCSVTVIVPGRFFTMDGEFARRGRYPISPGLSLVRAVAGAGGFTEWAQPKKLKLIRGGQTTIFNYYDMRDNPDKDIIIEPGDIISAPRSW